MDILVVEDDDAAREALAARLSEAGYSVRTASDGVGALESVRAKVPAVLVLDIVLPKLSGYDVLGELQRDSSLRRVPVIVVSGVPYDSKLSGSVGYFRKPVDVEALVRKVRQWAGDPQRRMER